MKNKTIVKLILVFCYLHSLSLIAQTVFAYPEERQRAKRGITYIVMPDTTTAVSMQYKGIFRKYWTASNIKFILPSEIRSVDTLKNSIFSMGELYYSVNSALLNVTPYLGLQIYGENLVNIYISTNPVKYGPPLNKTTNNDNSPLPANRIHCEPEREIMPSFSYGEEPEFAWGPGFLKNHIQQIMNYLNSGVEKSIKDETSDKGELQKLKNRVLYVPDYMLFRYILRGEPPFDIETQEWKEEDLMGKYKYSYKMITSSELNRMIIDSTQGIYYVLYTVSANNETISVTNSADGNIIYSKYTFFNTGLSKNDLGKISKEIDTK